MIINAKVKPNSPKQKIESLENNKYLIYLKEKAENFRIENSDSIRKSKDFRYNKANIELINLLRRYFGVPYTNIKIKNPASRNKIIELK